MSKYHILYNNYAGKGFNDELTQIIEKSFADNEIEYYDITKISYDELFNNKIKPDDGIVIVGGDGTLNRFVNATSDIKITNPIYFLSGGTGNDFLNDLEVDHKKPVQINKYIEKLPVVIVKGKSYKFINGIGYGIDGYCCEVGDELKAKNNGPVNYTSIAIKGLLFYYHPVNATVTVDGVVHKYKKVWLAPTMNGRYFGGGMMPTPNQDRLNKEKTVSVLIWHGKGKIKTLMAFPKIFEGKHTKYEKTCNIFKGHNIKVEFDRPTALQIDGETIKEVLSYEVKSYAALNSK